MNFSRWMEIRKGYETQSKTASSPPVVVTRVYVIVPSLPASISVAAMVTTDVPMLAFSGTG